MSRPKRSKPTRERINITLPPRQLELLERIADQEGECLSPLISRFLGLYLWEKYPEHMGKLDSAENTNAVYGKDQEPAA